MKNIFLLILISFNCYSQNAAKYSYYSNSEIKSLSLKIKNDIKGFQSTYDIQKKELVEKSKRTQQYFNITLKDSSFIKQVEISNYIDKILLEIKNSNPSITNIDDFTFLISKEHNANAASYSFNVFEINLGLVFLCEDEDELAFIICHEIAHQKLKHFERKEIESNEIYSHYHKDLKKSSGNENVKLQKDIIYKNSLISKQFESEADSLGLIYFSNTKYNINGAYSSLNKLGSMEELVYNHPADWKHDYGFNYDSIITSKKMFNSRILDNEFKISADSIRTHPDIEKRVTDIGGTYNPHDKANQYTEKQLLAIDCFIESANIHKNYTASFYLNNMLSTVYPDNKKYIENLIGIIDDIYTLKKQHKLGLYVDNINNNSNEIYINQIRSFFRESELYELKQSKTILTNKLNKL